MIRALIFALLLLTVCAAQAVPLPDSVSSELKKARIPIESVGIEVREVSSDAPLVSVNATQAMNPASTMKLLTTYAALDLLGPAYTWKTEAYLDGTLTDGVLRGNLVLKGYGDPQFTIEQLWLWLSELRARGLREIHGDLVLDRSYFDLPARDPGQFDNDPMRAYNVNPDALLINFNTFRLRYFPEDKSVRVITEPALDSIRLDNQLALRAGNRSCDDWKDGIRVQLANGVITVRGDFPEGCGEREQNLSLLPPTQYVDAVFRSVWKELGGTLTGKVREGRAGNAAKLFSAHDSPPLSDVIRGMNKFSNNVMARHLFLTLGVAGDSAGQGQASVALSIRAVQNWLRQKGLNLPNLALENGAGLSRVERITPDGMVNLLQSANAHPFIAELESSLPILGTDGTVKKRLRDKDATGHAHLKTGTLDGVKTIAGYVNSRSGKRWIVVFFINHANAAHGQAAQDALIEWVAGR